MANKVDVTSKMFDKLKAYKCFADECIFFKFIFSADDLKQLDKKAVEADDTVFKPEFVHQIFGDEETIFGYRGLRVNYYLTPGSLEAHIGLDYVEKVTERFDGLEPDDVLDAFAKFGCSPGFTRNLDVFCAEKLPADKLFRPFGIKCHEYQRASNNSKTRHYEVYKIDASMPEFTTPKFIQYMDRVQTLLVFYIESASMLASEDPQWTFFLTYERLDDSAYATVAFVSLYNYYAYPDKKRSRVSQVFVMPTHQCLGHGAELVEAVYRDAISDPCVLDITAESPSPQFIKIRDYVTTKMCVTSIPSFRDKTALKVVVSLFFLLLKLCH
jgi:histone acetyltransferase 1